jgi:hypothetical protein
MWPLAQWAADFAIDPPDFSLTGPGFAYGPDQQIYDAKYDYRWQLSEAAFRLVVLSGVYWLVAFAIGAAKIDGPSRKWSRRPDLWLAIALFAGIAFAFLQAGRRFALGPMIAACVARHQPVLRAGEYCFDCSVHSCEASIYMAVGLAGLMLMIVLMGWSLWLRRRASKQALNQGPR